MADFNPFAQEVGEDFNPYPIDEPPVQGPDNGVTNKAHLYTAVFGGSTKDYQQRLSAGEEARLNARAAIERREIEEQGVIEEINYGLGNDLTIEKLEQIRSQSLLGQSLVAPTHALLASNSQFSRTELRAYSRSAFVDQLIGEKVKQTTGGIADVVGEFADLIVSDGLANLAGATSTRNQLAKNLNTLLFSEMSEEQFAIEAQSILNDMADQGFFTEENSIYLQAFLAQAAESGVGEQAFEDQAFANLDFALAGVSAASVLKSGVKTVGAINTIRKLNSRGLAKNLTVESAIDGDATVDIVRNTSPNALTPARVDSLDHAGIALQAAREIEAMNPIMQFILKQTSFAGAIDDTVVEALKVSELEKYRKTVEETTTRRLIDFDVQDDGLRNYSASIYLGKANASPFTTRNSAQKLAHRVGGEVIEQVDEGKIKYLVRQSYNIQTNKLVNPTDIREVSGSMLSRLFSTTSRTTKELDAILKINEAQASKVAKFAGAEYDKARRRASKEEAGLVDRIILELRDDPAFNNRATPYTPSEFALRYEQKFGKPPREEAVDLYRQTLILNDAEYFLRADPILKRAVENGEAMYTIDGRVLRGKEVSNVDEGFKIYNVQTGDFLDQSDELIKNAKIIEVAEGGYNLPTGDIRYVIDTKATKRRLYHHDVLGYNPGGHRSYNARFFVKQTGVKKLADGNLVAGKPRTFMAVVTEKEARLATDQINTIMKAIRDALGGGDSLTKEAIEAGKATLLRNDALNDLVRANNGWNNDIESIEDFLKFADEWGIDLSKTVDFAHDGEVIASSRFAGGQTVGEDFLVNTNGRRGSRPLLGYGGQNADTYDPTSAVERSFNIALNRFSDQAYTTRAVNGWLKAAEDGGFIQNPADLVGKSPIEQMRAVKLTSKSGSEKFASERDLIDFKIGYRTQDAIGWDRVTRAAADYIYDSGYKKFSQGIRDLDNPINFMRSFAFHSKLGLFAVDQIMVQASQIVNIVGLSPVKGIQGASAVVPLRMALKARNEATIDAIAKASGAVNGIAPEDFKLILKWLRDSGRDIVDQNIIELDGNQTFYRSGFKRFVNAGRVFFNEGELYARINGVATAVLEYKAKFPDGNPFSDAGRRWITRRQDILTASMTNASAAPWQKTAAAVPTQFLTYHMRMMEQLFVGKTLTPAERTRLLAVQSLVFGGSGMFFGPIGYGYWQDRLAYSHGVGVDEDMYALIRYGLADYAISGFTGADTALAARLGVGEGFTDLIRKVGEGSFGEVIAGPSGQILQDTGSATLTLARNMFSGQWEYSSYDFIKVARNITSVNRAYNTWVAANYGEVRRRSDGSTVLTDLDPGDVFATALGIPLQESELAYTILDFQKDADEHTKEHAKKMREMKRIMIDYIDKGDLVSAKEVGDDITAMWWMLTPYNQDKVFKQLSYGDEDFFESIMLRELRRGHQSPLTDAGRNLLNGGT